MRKLFFIMITCALGISACSNEPKNKIRVYGWEGEGKETTEKSVRRDFKKWKQYGLYGICYNVGGFNVEKHTYAARIAHKNNLEYHAWIPAMLKAMLTPLGMP